MLLADREQFRAQLSELCAGFNVPLNDVRMEAYWRGLQKMDLAAFARVVEHALSEDGPEKVPSSHDCWTIHKRLRRPSYLAPVRPDTPAPSPNVHPFVAFANRRLLAFLLERGAATDESLNDLVCAKNRVAHDYIELSRSEHIRPDEVAKTLKSEFRRSWRERR